MKGTKPKFEVSPHQPNVQDDGWMRVALEQASKAAEQGEVPIGAVVVCQGEMIAHAHNAPIANINACAHAEMLAIERACKAIGNYRLGSACTLYVTLQPCLMCLGAIAHARIGRVVIGSRQSRYNTHLEDAIRVLEGSEALHPCRFEWGCLAEASERLLQAFFKARRLGRLDAMSAIKRLADLPNVNKHSLTLLAQLGIHTPLDLHSHLRDDATQDELFIGLRRVAEQCLAKDDRQQSAILLSLCDYLAGEPVRSWKEYL
ncbi:MAG TPA: deaminase [Limnobacter sp.]|nr:deaminase [Limnobacter sp.]